MWIRGVQALSGWGGVHSDIGVIRQQQQTVEDSSTKQCKAACLDRERDSVSDEETEIMLSTRNRSRGDVEAEEEGRGVQGSYWPPGSWDWTQSL